MGLMGSDFFAPFRDLEGRRFFRASVALLTRMSDRLSTSMQLFALLQGLLGWKVYDGS